MLNFYNTKLMCFQKTLKKKIEKIKSDHILKIPKHPEKTLDIKSNLDMKKSLISIKKTVDSATSTSTELDYTKEELQMVQKINSSKNLYNILGVNEDATKSEIQKAYKVLALKIHPDKNKAPGADEAFKKVKNAAVALSKHHKKDKMIVKTATSMSQFNNNTSIHYNRNGLKLTQQNLNNIVNVLFKAKLNRKRNFYNLILLMNGITVEKNHTIKFLYSLFRTPVYSVCKITKNYKIRYFVGQDFHLKFYKSIGQIEKTIEDKFLMDFLIVLSVNNYIKSHIFH